MLTVGCLYFQAVADEPRIATDEAQGRDGTGAFDQATDQVNAGTTAYIDAMRSKEPQARQQQMKTKPISPGMPRNFRDHGIMTMITGPPKKHTMKAKTIPAGQFKAHCLAIMDEVQAKREAVLITKRGKPVAKLVPVEEKKDDIFGFYKGKGKILGDVLSPAFTPEEWGDLY